MLEEINGTGVRLLQLRAKLKARENKKEFKENCEAIRAEIARLEAITSAPAEPVASKSKKAKGGVKDQRS